MWKLMKLHVSVIVKVENHVAFSYLEIKKSCELVYKKNHMH